MRGEEVSIEIKGVVRQGFKGHCRSATCRAEVVFVPLNGRTPPYDPNGESHFITCPDAAKWKNRSKKEPTQPKLPLVGEVPHARAYVNNRLLESS